MPFSGKCIQQADRFAPLACESLAPHPKLGLWEIVAARSECVLGGLECNSPITDQQIEVNSVFNHLASVIVASSRPRATNPIVLSNLVAGSTRPSPTRAPRSAGGSPSATAHVAGF